MRGKARRSAEGEGWKSAQLCLRLPFSANSDRECNSTLFGRSMKAVTPASAVMYQVTAPLLSICSASAEQLRSGLAGRKRGKLGAGELEGRREEAEGGTGVHFEAR